jgi:hypothetical protein
MQPMRSSPHRRSRVGRACSRTLPCPPAKAYRVAQSAWPAARRHQGGPDGRKGPTGRRDRPQRQLVRCAHAATNASNRRRRGQERERLEKLEKERVEQLLTEVEHWRRAADLRKFVEAVRTRSQVHDPDATEKLDRWSDSVLAVADRIDPIRSGRILGGSLEAIR